MLCIYSYIHTHNITFLRGCITLSYGYTSMMLCNRLDFTLVSVIWGTERDVQGVIDAQ